jgi:hypothetical protein
MSTVYLFGTWHHYQTRTTSLGTPESEFDAFEAELRRASNLFAFDAIAEELAPLDDDGPPAPTVAEKLAIDLALHHERLDIGKKARADRGLPYSEQWICFNARAGLLSRFAGLRAIARCMLLASRFGSKHWPGWHASSSLFCSSSVAPTSKA